VNGVQAIKVAFDGSHRWFQGTIADVTQEHADVVPEGVAHPIGELIAHVLHSEDFMINTAIQGKPTVWETDGWAERLGVPLMLGQESESARAFRCDTQAMRDYSQAVYASTEAFFADLSDADLDGELDLTDMGMDKYPLGVFLTNLLLGNNYAHTGEISALKGILGMRGYPF
jgi:hypothetical protein